MSYIRKVPTLMFCGLLTVFSIYFLSGISQDVSSRPRLLTANKDTESLPNYAAFTIPRNTDVGNTYAHIIKDISAKEYPDAATSRNNAATSFQITTRQRSSLVRFKEAMARFSPKTSESCPSSKESSSFCPMQPCSIRSVSTMDQLKKYILMHAEDVPLLPEPQHILQVEQDLLSLPALNDVRETPSLTLSRLTSVDREVKDGVITCTVGDVVRLRADLVDGYGKHRTMGHDDVRGWMVEITVNSEKPRRAGAEVVDMKNGSYVVSFRCLWAGSSRVYVGVAYPREYLALVLRRRNAGISRFSAGEFNNRRGQRELTPCFSTPNLPWPCLCNLTEFNNASFYCGRPLDPRLSCKDLVAMGALPTRRETIGVSPVEEKLMATMSRPAMKMKIEKPLVLNAAPGVFNPAVDTPCKLAKPNITWSASYPKGYFDSTGTWHTTLCRPGNLTETRIKSCLTNTTIWLLGDSNCMKIMDELKKILHPNLKCRTLRPQWYAIETCVFNDINFSLSFSRHEHNFYFSKGLNLSPVYKDKSVSQMLDSMPSSGRLLVVVHYFLHSICAHLAVSLDRLQMARAAMLRLLKRNPEVTIALRGPHVSQQEWAVNHLHGGDTQALFYMEMVKDVFKDMRDRVVFLDGWDMTIALENDLFHPTNNVPRGMVDLLLDYFCD